MEIPERWVYLDGEFIQEHLAALPIADRGFQFGDGVFTTVRISDGRPELLTQHLRRLSLHAETIGFTFPAIEGDTIDALIKRNRAEKGIWRLKIIVTAAEEGSRRHLGHLLMTMAHYEWHPFKPVRLSIFPHPLERPLAEVKSLSYLDCLYAEQHAQQQGADEALICGRDGVILETNRSNFFWVHASICYIPDERLCFLKGIFFQNFKSLIPFLIEPVKATISDVPRTAQLFLCNSMSHLRPVVAVDQIAFTRNREVETLLNQSLARQFPIYKHTI